MSNEPVVTAAMLAIGDELLSGRTKDKNIGHLADMLQLSGIDLKEVRIVADDEDAIVEALNALRSKYDYVFTSGGIGPTHDDITADAVSKAFGVPCEYDAAAMTLLGDMYKRREMEFTEARQRMARMPRGAAHIANPVSTAPGFVIGNVYVMAGVPQVFQAMLDNVLPTLRTGHARAFAGDLLPLCRRRYRHAARRHPEGPSGNQHRLLSALHRPEIFNGDRRARPVAERPSTPRAPRFTR